MSDFDADTQPNLNLAEQMAGAATQINTRVDAEPSKTTLSQGNPSSANPQGKVKHQSPDDIASLNIPGFTVKKFIARGGMASVYLAKQEALGRDVALKIMDKSDDKTFTERFLNEGRLVASMSHPNVITIFDLGVLDDGRAYISMEYVDGGDLEGLMRQPMTEKQVVGMLRSLAEALSYVHEHGVIHRDIKPANILLRGDNSLVLTDFGVARHEEQDQRFTRDGQAVGSPGYMSPEQAQALALDNRTDLYSVGVIFTEMLLGVNPYIADSFVQTSLNHLQMPVPDLPMEICQYQMLLEKMLAKKSDKRFKDAAMLIRFIDALEEPADVLLPRYSDDEAAQKAFEELRRPLSHPQANAKTSSPSMRASGIQEIQASLEEEPDLSSDKLYSSSGNWLTILIFSLLIGGAGYGYYFHYEVSVLLERGDKAIAAKRLLVPEGDNAFYYFDTVLKRAPDNAQAKQGMQQIADKYYTLAAQALKAKRTQRAQQMLTRGLKVSPEHAGLLKLQKRLKR